MAQRQLIIVPGLGDRRWTYHCLALWWRFLGFRVHIHVFGWEAKQPFGQALARLIKRVDALPDSVYIIGASAGGTAAVHALAARPEHIVRIATICTPYAYHSKMRNILLKESIRKLLLAARHTGIVPNGSRIVSVYAATDDVVPIKCSTPENIRTLPLRSHGHGWSIFVALTIKAPRIKLFLLSGQLG